MAFRTVRYGSIDVCFRPELEGGGMGFGQDYVPVVRELFGRVGRVHEFCAGPGFIGFSLLAHGLCDSLCLTDVNPAAVEAARETVRRNRLEGRVAVYLSDALDSVPPSERWDLVVSNPPHFRVGYEGSLRHYDADWLCHRKLYGGVAGFLAPGGSLLIQENYAGSEEGDFEAMIESAGLQAVGSLMHRGGRDVFDSYYFIWSRLRGESPAPRLGEAGSSFTRVSGIAEVVSLDVATKATARLRMKPYHRYRMRLSNRGERDASLSVYALRLGLFPKFLRSICDVAAGSETNTFPFQWLPGRYRIVDLVARRTVAQVEVAD